MSARSSIVTSMTWQPLSRRTKGLGPDGPFEGVPPHLRALLADWVTETLNRSGLQSKATTVGVVMRFPMAPGRSPWGVTADLVETALKDDEFFLDLVDSTLKVFGQWENNYVSLRELLALAGSCWTVGVDCVSLTRVVSEELAQLVPEVTSPSDAISGELREAWANAYGRNGDPSDAWDHAIKALESALIPVVVPKKAKPNLGDVLGVLRANDGGKWKSAFPGKDDDNPVEQMVKTLEQIWPNIDRHQGVQVARQPTAAEARSVVAPTAALIQAHRESPLVYKV